MPSNSANDYSLLHLQAHEDRLQKLESNLSETRIDITQLTEITKQGFERISNKVDEVGSSQQDLGKRLDSIAPKVEVLEGERRQSIKRWNSTKKVVGGILLTGLGAAVTQFGERILNIFIGQ
jgi:hypothetical protein